MTIIADAEASIGTFMPTTITALAAAELGFAGPITDIEAKIAGAAKATASIAIQPPSLELAAAIDGALQLPGVSVSIDSMLTLAAALKVDLLALQLALKLVLAVKGDLAASVHFVAVEGAVTSMAQEVGGVLAGDTGADGVAVMLVAKESGSVAALRTLFGLA